MALKDYADREEILLVGSSSTAPSLAIPNDNIIRLVTDDTCQGKVMAEVLASRNIKDLIPIYRDDLWGQDLLNATRESFEARNGLVGKGVAFKPNSTSYLAEVEALGAEVKNASAIYGADKLGVYLISFEQVANNYCGATGRAMLNEAGDRDFADYSLLQVEKTDKGCAWKKVGLYYADFNESGLEWMD